MKKGMLKNIIVTYRYMFEELMEMECLCCSDIFEERIESLYNYYNELFDFIEKEYNYIPSEKEYEFCKKKGKYWASVQ